MCATTADQLPSEEIYAWPTDGKLRRSFVMYTNGEHPSIDRLAVMMQTLGEMTEDNERRAALAYAADFYGFKVYAK